MTQTPWIASHVRADATLGYPIVTVLRTDHITADELSQQVTAVAQAARARYLALPAAAKQRERELLRSAAALPTGQGD